MEDSDIAETVYELPLLLPPLKRASTVAFKEPTLPWLTGKRRRQNDLISSDPPLFSSDDLPEAVENYASQRPKRLRQGPWWDGSIDGREPSNSKRPRRKKGGLTRNLDSGVFMGSEGTEVSDEEELEETPGEVDWTEYSIGNDADPLPSTHLSPALQSSQGIKLPVPENLEPSGWESWDQRGQCIADRAVLACLESGTESVDLSNLGLRSAPPALTSLKSMTKCPPSQEAFAPLTPSIRLFLHKNNLRSLSSGIFDLDRITVLSLRHNKLEYLPPAIGQLVNLEELNLAGNRLKYLPWELLKLVRGGLKRLYVYPNPFIERELLQHSETCRPWYPSCLAKGSIAYLTRTGQPARDSTGALMSACTSPESALSTKEDPPKPLLLSLETRAPSLLELALQRCSEAHDLGQLGEYLPNDVSPDIRQLLENAQQVKDSGGRLCSVCGRKFIVARTEWIEWWDCIPQGPVAVLPLLRQGCSWQCTAEQVS